MTATTVKSSNSYVAADSSCRVVAPLYAKVSSRHLAKRILNSLRAACGADAGTPAIPGRISVQDNTIPQAQIDLERRIGLSLHVLRTLLLSNEREGLPLDQLLRIQKECDFVFIDSALIQKSWKAALNHYLGHGGYTEKEFNALKATVTIEEDDG